MKGGFLNEITSASDYIEFTSQFFSFFQRKELLDENEEINERKRLYRISNEIRNVVTILNLRLNFSSFQKEKLLDDSPFFSFFQRKELLDENYI